MIKKSTLISLLLIVGILIAAYFITKPRTLRCQADLIDEAYVYGAGNVRSDVRLNYIFNLNGSGDGLVNMIGFINSDKNRYRLNRTLSFNYKVYDNNIYEFKFHTENVNTNDTTPNLLRTALFKTADEGGTYYHRLSRITDNVFLIHRIGEPVLLCHKY